MATRLYVDTSAYLCVLLHEAGAAELERAFRGAELLSSTLFVLEAYRNLVRLSRGGELSAADAEACLDRLEQDIECFALREPTLDLCRGRVMPHLSTPRSLDLLHLRTALAFHREEPLTRFVSRDQTQKQAARELGLPV